MVTIPRKEFDLPEEDFDFLSGLGLIWETIMYSNQHWVIIHNYPIPKGYTVNNASIALRLEGYPVSQIDMAYFYPHLVRLDGKPIIRDAKLVIDDKSFQQWSRHRTNNNPWEPGEDCISTHLLMFDYLLKNELNR
jgi:hypothetical protein